MINNLLANAGATIGILVGIVVALIFVMAVLVVLTRYKKCPSDKVMVIYGKITANKDGTYRSAKCIHGGAALVWPFVQSYTLDRKSVV